MATNTTVVMGDLAGTQMWTATRDGAGAGSGTWSSLTKIVDIGGAGLIWFTVITGGPTANGISSGQLGIVTDGSIAPDAGLFFVGNGGTPKVISAFNTGGLLSAFTYVGSWRIGSADYLAIVYGVPHRLTVIKSTDSGATWIELDAANAPSNGGSPKWTARRQGNTLYTATGQDINVGSTITLTDFDFSTETWGAPYGALTLTLTPGTGDYNLQNGDSIVFFANGDRGLFYATTPDGNSYDLSYRLYSAGAWGAATLVATGAATFGLAPTQYATILIDPSGDLLHVFRYRYVGTEWPNGYQLIYQTVTHSGAASGNLFTFPSTNPLGTFPSGNGTINDGNIYIGYSADNSACTIWAATLGTANFLPETLPAFANQSTRAFMLVPLAPLALTNPGQGARKPVALPVNGFDFCLHREYRLYCSINVAMLTCGSIPACFSVDERDWGVDG